MSLVSQNECVRVCVGGRKLLVELDVDKDTRISTRYRQKFPQKTVKLKEVYHNVKRTRGAIVFVSYTSHFGALSASYVVPEAPNVTFTLTIQWVPGKKGDF